MDASLLHLRAARHRGMLKVSLSDKQGNVSVRHIHRDEVTVIKMPEKKSQEKK